MSNKMPKKAPRSKPCLRFEDVADLTRRPGRRSFATYTPDPGQSRTPEDIAELKKVIHGKRGN